MCWYVGTQLYGVIGCGVAIPSYDTSRIGFFTHMTYDEVDRVFTVVFYNFLCAFCTVDNHVVVCFVGSSSGTRTGPSLSITRAYAQFCHTVFSERLLWVLELV